LQIKSYYENTNFKNFYIVGDKLTQDILPASKADFKTIYFQPFNQKHSEKIDDKNIKVITDFKQLLDIF
jgi:FMN phosphatase YigB (HAD superfamily)